jgi:HK97 family phage major capsid protein
MDPKMKAAIERQHAAKAAMDTAGDALEALIGTTDGTADERKAALDAAKEQSRIAEQAYELATHEIETLEGIGKQRAAMPRELPKESPSSQTSPGTIVVGKEALTYRPDVKVGFFNDLTRAGSGDPKAYDRLVRNNAEYGDWAKANLSPTQLNAAGVNQTATSGGEFVPPVWYVDQYAPLLRVGRPFLNALGTSDLPPDTNSLNFPKITTGSSAAAQTDAGSVSNTDLVTTSVTAQVQTVAGRTIASYQFVELGPISDQVVMQDLTAAYNTQVDLLALTGAVTNAKGLVNVASTNTVTYTDATPTGGEFFAPTAQSASQIAKNAFVGVDMGVTHPSIWYNILSGLDSQLRPLYLSVGTGVNTLGDGTFVQDPANGLVGNIGGIPICIDANMPTNLGGGTNESRLVFLNRRGFDFWESPPRFKVADQTSIANLQYQFVMYGFYATTSRQAKMISIVSGTGFIPVTGF